jgi:hypothetical protein
MAGPIRSHPSREVACETADSDPDRDGMECHCGRVVVDGDWGTAMMIRRTEIMSIGEQLVAAGARAGPLDIARVGGLLRRLALAYGQCVEADEVRRRQMDATARGLAPERRNVP